MELQKLFFYLKKAPELWGKKMEKNIEMSGMINGFIQKKKEKKVLAKVTWIFRKQWDLGHAYPRLYIGRGQQG